MSVSTPPQNQAATIAPAAGPGSPSANGNLSAAIKTSLRYGLLTGKVQVSPDFDAPLPDGVAVALAGR